MPQLVSIPPDCSPMMLVVEVLISLRDRLEPSHEFKQEGG